MDAKVTNTTLALLDQWKKKKGFTSDNAAAIELGLTRAAISAWRSMRNHAGVTVADRMATDLGLKVIEVLAAIEADRATKPEEQAVWRRYGKAAFMTLLVGFALPGALPSGIQAAQANAGITVQTTNLNIPLCEVAKASSGGYRAPRHPRSVISNHGKRSA